MNGPTAPDGLAAALAALERAGCNPRKSGSGYEARCPAHEDTKASLRLKAGTSAPVVFHCFANCEPMVVLDAMKPTPEERDAILGGHRREPVRPVKPQTLHYTYQDEHSVPLFRVVRQDGPGGKRFWQERPDGNGGWTVKSPGKNECGESLPVLHGIRRVLYRLPETLDANSAGRTIYVLEGEKCVDALVCLGLDATCNPMGAGAGKWLHEHSETLRGARAVRVLADNDRQGEAHAQAVAQALHLAGVVDLRLVRFPGQTKPDGTAGGDVADWLEAHASIPLEARRTALLDLIEAAPAWTPEEEKPEPGLAAHELRPVEYLDLEADAPPVVWILPGWLARGDVAILAAKPYTGKSTLAAALGIAVATGCEWCGIQPTETGVVLHFDEEQGTGTVLRLFQKLGVRNHPNLKVASSQGMMLGTPEGLKRLEAQIAEHRPALVVFDTVAQVFAGVNLSSLEDVSAVFRGVFRLRNEYGVAFLFLTHNRKAPTDGRIIDPLELMFGSIGFGGNPDTVWSASRPGNVALELRQHKRREVDELKKLRVTKTVDEDGQITLTAEPLEDTQTAQDGVGVFLVKWLEGRPYKRAKRKELIEAAKGEGERERTVERALVQLVATGRVLKPPRTRGVYQLAQVAAEAEAESFPF